MEGNLPVTARSVDAASRVLAAAFATDPVFRWMAHDQTGLDQRLRHGFRAMIRLELRGDRPEVVMTNDGGCAAIWHGIDRWQTSDVDALRLAPAFIRSFGPRLGRLMRTMTMMDDQHPTEPHYHLAFIGTDPARKGKGLGSALMTQMTQRCDLEGIPAYLENSNPQNEAFYVRHGFSVTSRLDLPVGAPPATAMWRDPRPPSRR